MYRRFENIGQIANRPFLLIRHYCDIAIALLGSTYIQNQKRATHAIIPTECLSIY